MSQRSDRIRQDNQREIERVGRWLSEPMDAIELLRDHLKDYSPRFSKRVDGILRKLELLQEDMEKPPKTRTAICPPLSQDSSNGS